MKLSVIVPCYNVQDVVEPCVKSIVAQKISDMEIILINDGSTDQTPLICDQLQAKHDQVKVIHQENGGLSDARNTGMNHAKGDYIAFVDSDDILVGEIYQIMIDRMEKEKAQVGVFNLVRVFKDRQEVQESLNQVVESSNDFLEILFKYKGANFYAWNKIIKADLLKEIRYEKGVMYEDILFSYKLSFLVDRAIISTQVGIHYIDNDQSIVNQTFNAKQYDNVWEREKLYHSVKYFNQSPYLEDLALDKLVDGFLSTGFKIAQSKGQLADRYYYLLLEDMDFYKDQIKSCKQVSPAKKVALHLLKMNRGLYYRLYKVYLGK